MWAPHGSPVCNDTEGRGVQQEALLLTNAAPELGSLSAFPCWQVERAVLPLKARAASCCSSARTLQQQHRPPCCGSALYKGCTPPHSSQPEAPPAEHTHACLPAGRVPSRLRARGTGDADAEGPRHAPAGQGPGHQVGLCSRPPLSELLPVPWDGMQPRPALPQSSCTCYQQGGVCSRPSLCELLCVLLSRRCSGAPALA